MTPTWSRQAEGAAHAAPPRGPAPLCYRARAADGVELSLARMTSAAPRRTPVLLVHGAFSNARSCLPLAGDLCEAGFDAWVMELRGHGASQRWYPHPRFEAFALLDVPSAVRAVREHTGHDDVFLVGHSGGGLALLMYLARRQDVASVRGLVTLGAQATDACSTWAGALLMWPLRLATLILGYTPGPAVSLGPENEWRGALEAWFRWNRTGRWIGDDGFEYFAALESVRVPVLCFAGAGDRLIAPVSGCRKVYDALGSLDKQWVLCGTAQGFAEDYGHARMLASRSAQKDIWPRIVGWLERH